MKNIGKEVKNKSRTLKCFLSHSQIALWFSESYGLEISSIKVKEIKTGQKHKEAAAERHTASGFDGLSVEKWQLQQPIFDIDNMAPKKKTLRHHLQVHLSRSLLEMVLVFQRIVHHSTESS